MHICLQPFAEQLVDRVDARRRRTHLGGCPADSRDQAQLSGDDIAARYGSERDRGRRVSG
jgi:hypothetical protein